MNISQRSDTTQEQILDALTSRIDVRGSKLQIEVRPDSTMYDSYAVADHIVTLADNRYSVRVRIEAGVTARSDWSRRADRIAKQLLTEWALMRLLPQDKIEHG